MGKTSVLKIVNPVIALLLLCQVCSALLMITLGDEIFETLHKTGGVLLAGGVLLHLSLNWNWVKASYLETTGRADGSLPRGCLDPGGRAHP